MKYEVKIHFCKTQKESDSYLCGVLKDCKNDPGGQDKWQYRQWLTICHTSHDEDPTRDNIKQAHARQKGNAEIHEKFLPPDSSGLIKFLPEQNLVPLPPLPSRSYWAPAAIFGDLQQKRYSKTGSPAWILWNWPINGLDHAGSLKFRWRLQANRCPILFA